MKPVAVSSHKSAPKLGRKGSIKVSDDQCYVKHVVVQIVPSCLMHVFKIEYWYIGDASVLIHDLVGIHLYHLSGVLHIP